jgi:hypothetical protein
MNTLQKLQDFINEFNQSNKIDFEIDSIRIEFSKQYKRERLDTLGNWHKINKNDKKIMEKLKKRLAIDEVTSAYQLDNLNIYYYNKKDITTKYRKAEMVIFGLKQYHKDPPPYPMVEKIVSILKDVSNVDICFDMIEKPNFENLSKYFNLTQYRTKEGIFTNTFYINQTFNEMIEKIVIYDKQYKNSLTHSLWRIEAKMIIPNSKFLSLPLNEFLKIINLTRGANDQKTI